MDFQKKYLSEVGSYFFNDDDIEIVIQKTIALKKDLLKKQKEDEPATILEFLFAMNNFKMFFDPSKNAEFWRNQNCFKKVVASADEADFNIIFKNIQKDIKNFSFNDVFKNEAKPLYKNLYKAYLLMRKYTEQGDADLYC